jgi:hypothetical protein
MSVEYVRLTHPELVFGEANLLQSEISLLTMMQKYSEFTSQRKEELALKIVLKKEIEEAKAALDELDRILPRTSFHEEHKKEEKLKKEIAEKIVAREEESKGKKEAVPKKTSIQKELDDIKVKLARLQRG